MTKINTPVTYTSSSFLNGAFFDAEEASIEPEVIIDALNRTADLEAKLATAREALDEIENPIKYIKLRLQPNQRLDGVMAIHLSESSTYLKEIATKALSAITDGKKAVPTLPKWKPSSFADTKYVDVKQPIRSCNRHSNCDEKPTGSRCCHDEDCEDCFGK